MNVLFSFSVTTQSGLRGALQKTQLNIAPQVLIVRLVLWHHLVSLWSSISKVYTNTNTLHVYLSYMKEAERLGGCEGCLSVSRERKAELR